MTWDPIAEPIDYIILAGRESPGLAEVRNAGSPRKWDERAGYGWSGSYPVFIRRELTKFKVLIKLNTRADWAGWYAWSGLVAKPPFGKFPKALDIWHPFLEDQQVASAEVIDVSQPEPDGTGAFVITIDFMEFRRPKFTLVKPTAAEAPGPKDARDRELDANSAEIARKRDALSAP